MKPIYWLVLAGIVLLAACDKKLQQIQEPTNYVDFDKLTFPHSMKGWELYSQPVGDDWRYSLLMGTNRLKSYNEVVSNDIAVTGEDSLKMLLVKVPLGETITWLGRGWLSSCWIEDPRNLALPPPAIVNDIREYCVQRQIVLEIAD